MHLPVEERTGWGDRGAAAHSSAPQARLPRELSDQLHRFPIIPYFAATFCGSTAPMPIYAYRCAACGHAKDVLQKMSDPPLADLPGLRRAALREAGHRGGLPAQGLGLVRDRLPQPAGRAGSHQARRRQAGGRQAGRRQGREGRRGRRRCRCARRRRRRHRLRRPPRRRPRPPAAPPAPPATRAEAEHRAMKKYLIAGLLVWLPLAVTIWVLPPCSAWSTACSAGCSAPRRRCCPTAAHALPRDAAPRPGLGVLVMVRRRCC